MTRTTSFYDFVQKHLPDMTHTARAKALGVPLTTLRGWSHPDRIPSSKMIPKIAKALHVKQSLLYQWIEERTAA